MDHLGNLVVATSTGRTLRKLPDRVGGMPIMDAGAYPDKTIDADLAIGYGE